MVANFNRKVDLNKVSKTVKDYVANIAKTEGNKKKIDTDREFYALSNLLAGNVYTMNKDEIGYIEGFMFEYQNKKQKEFEEDAVTENTKKEVSKIAKRMGNKKQIDSDEEAQALAIMLRNSHNDLNAADITYITQLLLKSGYAHYLEPQNPQVNVVNVIVEEADTKKSTENEKTCEENKNTKNEGGLDTKEKVHSAPKQKRNQVLKEANRAKKEADRSKREADRSKAEADRSKREADRSKAEADRAKKEADSIKRAPKVSEKARAEGFSIANKIQEELHDFWTNDGTVERELYNVNSENAYSFVGKMMGVSDKHNVFGSFYKRVSASSVCHVVLSLLNQAKKIGLAKDPAFIKLEETYKFLERQYEDKSPRDPIYDNRDIQKLDIQIKSLYNGMSKVYK